MPEGLEIDHANPLNGVMAGYAEHVVVCTGKDDWPSKIEDENSGDNLAADLKELFGRGGKYTDVSAKQTTCVHETTRGEMLSNAPKLNHQIAL
jgi:hypothetical protein